MTQKQLSHSPPRHQSIQQLNHPPVLHVEERLLATGGPVAEDLDHDARIGAGVLHITRVHVDLVDAPTGGGREAIRRRSSS